MEKKEQSFADKFIEIIKDNVDENVFNAEKMNDMDNGIRLTDKKIKNRYSISKTTLYEPEKHDGVALIFNACAVFFDAENIKNESIINQIDKFKLKNSKELKNLFKTAIELYTGKKFQMVLDEDQNENLEEKEQEDEKYDNSNGFNEFYVINNEQQEKDKYKGISNEMYDKKRYGSISSENFNKKNNDKKNNKKASIFRNFFPFGKGKGK